MQFRAQSSASPTAAGARRAALLCYPHRGRFLGKGPGFIHRGGPSLPSFLSKSAPPARTCVLPHGEALGPRTRGCMPPAGHIPSGTPIHSFPVGVEKGVSDGTCSSVQSSRCATNRGKATSSSCSQPPRPWRSPGRAPAVEDGGLVRAPHQTDPASFLPLPSPNSPPNTLGFFNFVFVFFFVFCFPHPRTPAPPAWRRI